MTSPTTQNFNTTLSFSASSNFPYKVTEHKSLYDVDNWKTLPGRHAQLSVKKWTGVGKSEVEKEWEDLCDSAKLSLPGYMVQIIYLEAVNLQFSPSSKGFDLLLCLDWLTHIFSLLYRKFIEILGSLLGSLWNPKQKCVNSESQKSETKIEEMW